MTRQERRVAIRKLVRHVEKMGREILAEHAGDPEKNERSYLWDPLATICFELGIARRKLSSYSKELTGMAAHEIIDKIRAEDVKAKMREDLVRFVKRNWPHPGGKMQDWKYSSTLRWEFYWTLRRQRDGAPDYEASVVAMQYGFPNEARYRRACVLCYGKTPRQLAFEILAAIAEYFWCAYELNERRQALHYPDRNPRTQEYAARPFSDAWAVARRERPEWLAAMRGEFGLAKELETHAEQE
jgi:AraC-like DNA-binding protein